MGIWTGGRGLAGGREGRGSAGRVPPGPWRPGCLGEGAGQIGGWLACSSLPVPWPKGPRADKPLPGWRPFLTPLPQTPHLPMPQWPPFSPPPRPSTTLPKYTILLHACWTCALSALHIWESPPLLAHPLPLFEKISPISLLLPHFTSLHWTASPGWTWMLKEKVPFLLARQPCTRRAKCKMDFSLLPTLLAGCPCAVNKLHNSTWTALGALPKLGVPWGSLTYLCMFHA